MVYENIMNNPIETNLLYPHVIYYYKLSIFIRVIKLIIKLLKNHELLQHRVISLN